MGHIAVILAVVLVAAARAADLPWTHSKVLTGVYAAALQRTQLSVYRNPDRVAINADRPDLAGLFGKQDATAQWDFRPADNPTHCLGELPINAWGCCNGFEPMVNPTTHALRETVMRHVVPMLQVDNVPEPDPDALVIYLRAGDIFNTSNPYLSQSYVQAPCSYLRKVIRDSGLFKIDIVTDPTAQQQLRHPCLAELQAMQAPYQVTVHGASIREDFGFLTKAHNLVLSGVSSFADTAVLLSRSLRTLYVSSWYFGDEAWHDDWVPSSMSGSFISYHDLPSIQVRRYAIHRYMESWDSEGPKRMLEHREEHVQRLQRFENIPLQHTDARYNVNAMSPSHSLAVVVQACEGRSTEEQLQHALREIDLDKMGYRVPLLVLAKDAAEADALRARFHVQNKGDGQEDVLTMNMNGISMGHSAGGQLTRELASGQPHGDTFRLPRLFGMAIVAPHAPLTPAPSCGNPHMDAVRTALHAAESTFNVTHLLFSDVPRYRDYLASTYANLQHVHGHRDRLRVFTTGNRPLCPPDENGIPWHTQWVSVHSPKDPSSNVHEARLRLNMHRLLQTRARMQGCADAIGFLVGARGPHTTLMEAAQSDVALSDVCMLALPSHTCVYGWARH